MSNPMSAEEHSARFVRQKDVLERVRYIWGDYYALSPEERALSFLEEALELVQAMGITPEQVVNYVDYTYGREVGEADQEIGGVMVTLQTLCQVMGYSLAIAEEQETQRLLQADDERVEKWRTKHKLKVEAGVRVPPPN